MSPPSSFASAAASGSNANSPKPETNEWTRRTNGATQTFRRPAGSSNSINTSVQQSEPPAAAPSRSSGGDPPVGVYIPPFRNGVATEHRYSKEQLLSIFRAEQEAGNLSINLSTVYVNGWEPNSANGTSATSPWIRREEQKDQNQATIDVCWDRDGSNVPLGLIPLSADEKELFNTSVNSPIKPPAQPTAKDGTPRDNTRKLSVSANQGSPGGYNLASPTSRPSNRRRDTNEASFPFPSQTGSGRFSRDEVANPPASLMRRRTEFKESQDKEEEEKEKSVPESANPSGTKRNTPGGFNSNGAWSASPSTSFSPMGGAFGSFALSPGTDKRPGFGSMRGGSRFKNLMKDNEEDVGDIKQKASLTNLGGFAEDDQEHPSVEETLSRNQDLLAGLGSSAAPMDDGMLGNMAQQTPHRPEPMSPTNTNPYQSPEGDKNDKGDMDLTGLHGPLPGLGGFTNDDNLNLLGLGPKPVPFGFNPAEQTHMPSAGPLGGLGALPGLGASSPWAPGLSATDASARDKTFGGAFGDNLLSTMEGQPSAPYGGPPMMGGMGRGSRLASLLPNPMGDIGQLGGEFDPFDRARQEMPNPLFVGGSIGNMPMRETDSPLRPRGLMDDSGIIDGSPAYSHSTPSTIPVPMSDIGAIGPQRTDSRGHRPGSTNNTSFQSPAPQVRQMVMPDRMKWEYKDHGGQTQGPFSGLEMHDWYKAGYFTPELLIKKLEDPEFEPLAQLIRRIGNSREPFLVPQIGIPHSPPPNQRPWQAGGSGIQPPFANSFPSFGTTLTAEQQNDLERRKQEAQYLMARQKEHLQQHQFMIAKMQHVHPPAHGTFPQQLHHQNSAQSLQSQPSIGSMTGPGTNFTGSQAPGSASQNQSTIPPLDTAFRGTQPPPMSGVEMLGNLRDEKVIGMMDRMVLGRSPNTQADPLDSNISPQVAAMLNDRSRLQQEQAEADAQQQMHPNDPAAQITADRLKQFHELRNEADEQMTPIQKLGDIHSHPELLAYENNEQMTDFSHEDQSMTQQVQMAAQKAAWNRVDHTTMQQIVPPPQSISPMPAPVAQRRQNVADTLTTASRSANQTPSAETPSASLAPWAKEVVEVPKGPSLKEIQEAEAKKAAQREEMAAAARRAALEKEVFAAQQAAAQQPQPGLPSTSTWASSTPSAAPGAPSSVWGARVGSAVRVVAPVQQAKKTLQQIQKEEEARKQRATVATVGTPTTAPPSTLSSGKRYADLAGKAAIGGLAQQPGTNPSGGAWTTVGAGGKTKTPVSATTPSVPARAVSGSVATVAQAASRPKQATRSTTLGGSQLGQLGNKSATADAMEEFRRWAVKELSSHLNKGINADAFVDNLLAIGLFEPEVITEAVHGASQTIDSRHFAEEFVRRHKLAASGVPAVPALPTAAKTAIPGGSAVTTGGWNEVAKKGPSTSAQQQDSLGSFKVVAGKKKGKR